MSRSFKKNPVSRLGSENDAKIRRQAAKMTRHLAKMAIRKGDWELALTARSKLENRGHWPSDDLSKRWGEGDAKIYRK